MNREITYEDIIILYEDNHILVIVKPFNIPVQADESKDKSLLEIMKEYVVDTYNKPGEAYLGLVHRLDRVTGGVMVFAKTSKAAARLTDSIKSGDFEKKYFTIVRGKVEKNKERLVHYLKKLESKNIVYTVPITTDGAKRAELEYRKIENTEDTTLLSISLITGRSHQIRVQLETIGHSIVGDSKYGEPIQNEIKCNLALWAYELRFTHPTKQEKMVFRVAVPENIYPWNLYPNMKKHIEITIKD